MGRPPRRRYVARLPRAGFFKPAGARAREIDQVVLGVDELEALRLVDLEGLSQEDAAASLGVSRQTVGRVLEQARRTVADALLNGKALLIGGGVFELAEEHLCTACGTHWAAGEPTPQDLETSSACPECGSTSVAAYVDPDAAHPGRGRGRGGGSARGHGAGRGHGQH